MRFMVFMISGNATAATGGPPNEGSTAAMMKYNEALAKAGVLLGVDSLQSSDKGARVEFSGGRTTVVDGAVTGARDFGGAYWLWQVKSKDEAIAWASRCPAANGDVLELRQLAELGLRARRGAPDGRRDRRGRSRTR